MAQLGHWHVSNTSIGNSNMAMLFIHYQVCWFPGNQSAQIIRQYAFLGIWCDWFSGFLVRRAQVLLQLKFTHDAKRNYRQIDAFGYKYFQSIRIYRLCPLVLGAVMDPIEAEPEIVAPNELHHSGWWVLIVGHISPSCIRYWVTLFIKSDIQNYIYTCTNAMKQGIRKKVMLHVTNYWNYWIFYTDGIIVTPNIYNAIAQMLILESNVRSELRHLKVSSVGRWNFIGATVLAPTIKSTYVLHLLSYWQHNCVFLIRMMIIRTKIYIAMT